MTCRQSVLSLALLGLCGCEFGPAQPIRPAFSKRDAGNILLKNEALWDEADREYAYEFSYYSGLFASTKSGTCRVGDTVACTWMDGLGESGTGTVPGRIQEFLDRIKEVHAEIEPDTCYLTGDGGLIVWERVQATDTTSVPVGYAVWFNEELGYMDSVILFPFGPNLRIKSMLIADRKP